MRTKGLEGGFPHLETKAEIMGGGENQMRNFSFVSQIFGEVILLIENKLTPPNGSCAQHPADTGVAVQYRHLLVCFVMCPRLAPVVSFA